MTSRRAALAARRRQDPRGPWYELPQARLLPELCELRRLYWRLKKRSQRNDLPFGRPGSREEAVAELLRVCRALRRADLKRFRKNIRATVRRLSEDT